MDAIPERKLLAAILQQAVLDAQDAPGKSGNDGKMVSRSSVAAARRYLFDWQESDACRYGTFPYICSHLELDAGAMRVRLGRYLAGVDASGERNRPALRNRYEWLDGIVEPDTGYVARYGRYRS